MNNPPRISHSRNYYYASLPSEITDRWDAQTHPSAGVGFWNEYDFYRWFRKLTSVGVILRKNKKGESKRYARNWQGAALLDRIPIKDTLQEIRLAILETGIAYDLNGAMTVEYKAGSEETTRLIRTISRKLYRLMRDFCIVKNSGTSRCKMRQEIALLENDKGELVDMVEIETTNPTVEAVLCLYDTTSVPKLCRNIGIREHNHIRKIQKKLSKEWGRGMGRGGNRRTKNFLGDVEGDLSLRQKKEIAFRRIRKYQTKKQCAICKRTVENWTMHHIFPQRYKRIDTAENTAGLCQRHHDEIELVNDAAEARGGKMTYAEFHALFKTYCEQGVVNTILKVKAGGFLRR